MEKEGSILYIQKKSAETAIDLLLTSMISRGITAASNHSLTSTDTLFKDAEKSAKKYNRTIKPESFAPVLDYLLSWTEIAADNGNYPLAKSLLEEMQNFGETWGLPYEEKQKAGANHLVHTLIVKANRSLECGFINRIEDFLDAADKIGTKYELSIYPRFQPIADKLLSNATEQERVGNNIGAKISFDKYTKIKNKYNLK